MTDGQSAFAEPMTMQEALAKADSLFEAKEAAPAEPAPEPEQVEADEAETQETEEITEVEQTDETEEPEATEEESAQVLTADEYGDVLVDLNGEPTPLSEVLKGNQRQADYTRKTMALAEQRKEMEAEFEAKAKDLAAREQQLSELEAELGEQEPDWKSLVKEDPLGYQEKKLEWEEKQAARAARKAEAEEARKQSKREFAAKTAATAIEVFPEWADVDKFNEGAPARKAAALSAGFAEEEYASTPDFRIATLLEKAARYDAMQSQQDTKRAIADKKIAKAPKVLKPGASSGDSDPAKERRAAFSKRLSKPISSADIAKSLGLR